MADDRRSNQMLERIDTDRLGAIPAETSALRANFLPATFSEAMELSKLMSAGTFVPERLRGKPGDCLAVVMLATRLKMDPFVVAQKVYFVNNQGIPGYEAQLVNAILNTSGHLDGRLLPEWEGEGEELVCIVSGKLKGDPRERKLRQPIKTISTRNSPLWKQSPKVQLAYHTSRSWARLHAPEALLGIYAADELVENNETERRLEARPAPTRAAVAARTADEPVKPRSETIVDRGEVVDAGTGEVVGREPEDEEETARALDRQTERQIDGADDDDGDDSDPQRSDELDDTVPQFLKQVDPGAKVDQPEQASGAAAGDESAGKAASSTVEPERAGAAPAPAEPAVETKPAIDWESWLGKLDTDLGKLGTEADVDALYASKQAKIADAPDGVKNRARGYVNARKRALEKAGEPESSTTRKRSTAASRTAAAAAGGADQGGEAGEPAKAAELSPTERADQIIARFTGAQLLIDLRSRKAEHDDEIDAMPEEEAGRINRAFRAREDQLRKPAA